MRALSGELDYRIRYDVEHDLFHAQNVFNDEYIKPTFIEYVQNLEKENKVLAQNLEDTEIINKTYEKRFKDLEKENAELKSLKDVADLIRLNNSHIVAMAQLNNNNVALRKENAELTKDMANAIPLLKKATVISDLLNKAKEIIKSLLLIADNKVSQMEFQLCVADAKQFISEVEND